MEQSLFIQWVKKYFNPIVAEVVEKVNGTKKQATYLFKTMLTREYSPTLKWSTLEVNGSTVAADVVAMDAPLPLKTRDSFGKADGDVPKLGMKLYLGEKDLTELDIIQRQPNQESQFIKKLFADVPKVITGVYEQLEYMFLQALSSGVTVVQDNKNVGLGIRVDFGYKAENKFNPAKVWSDVTATPIDDFNRIQDAADANGDVISIMMMDNVALNNLIKTTQFKESYAHSLGMSIDGNTKIPTPNVEQARSLILAVYGWEVRIVNRSVRIERNGIKTAEKPWQVGSVVFLNSDNVGRLVWGTLAEKNHGAKQVEYQDADEYILVSKYHKIDPLQEFTSSQALVLPVIDGVDSIRTLDTTVAQA